MKGRVIALASATMMVVCGMGRSDETTASDTKFIKEAASGGMLEVKLGQLAAERAEAADVRQFGQRMVTDHTKANQDLLSVAEKNSVKVEKNLDRKHQEVFDRLAALRGAEFDRAYMKHMVKDHEEDVTEVTKMSTKAQNIQVRTFATNTLPTLQEHLRMARAIAARLGQ